MKRNCWWTDLSIQKSGKHSWPYRRIVDRPGHAEELLVDNGKIHSSGRCTIATHETGNDNIDTVSFVGMALLLQLQLYFSKPYYLIKQRRYYCTYIYVISHLHRVLELLCSFFCCIHEGFRFFLAETVFSLGSSVLVCILLEEIK